MKSTQWNTFQEYGWNKDIFSQKQKKKKSLWLKDALKESLKDLPQAQVRKVKSEMGGIQSKESGKYVGKSKTLYMTTIKKKRRIINGI